ncbi:unnamed protein product [Candidula unifasciata]|uniref:PLD phosphodiesterase domain-containing protein n=1 Tax=Candidula unifasciata TaxID=100452 RepID=A0A8S3ZWY8_9EUPU|nr:unnamed protein product [Candidula unifasciata]
MSRFLHVSRADVGLPFVVLYLLDVSRLTETVKGSDLCIFTLVESVPDNLTYSEGPSLMSTYEAHKRLLDRAKQKIHLASFYWSLTDVDIHCPDNSSFQGQDIFQRLLDLVKAGQVDVKMAQNNTNNDTDELAKYGAGVRTVDFPRLEHAGVMHTKMWIIDESHVYIGSGNFDWRSYTQTKELGVLIEDCPCLGADAEKLFEVYWYLGSPNATIPDQWPDEYTTGINISSPLLVHYNNTEAHVYFSSSPPSFCPSGRANDIDAILNVIRSAKKFIYISVMDYYPLVIYSVNKTYWSLIDDALREAAVDRHVRVYLMASNWSHTESYMIPFLKSLYILNRTPHLRVNIQVKLFTVQSTPAQQTIPYARVNHSKYMVTDQHAYIGTSNWAGDYFKYTGGVGFILEQPDTGTNGTNLRRQLVHTFLQDWHSQYAQYVL